MENIEAALKSKIRDYAKLFDVEIDEISDTVLRLHKLTATLKKLSDPDVTALKKMSNRLTRS